MKDGKIDRRTQRTQQLLQEAIISLILEMSYDKITVQDIVDRANVGRSTFYTHYLDKEDLMESCAKSFRTGLDQLMTEASAAGGKGFPFPSLIIFRHAQQKPQLSKMLIGGQGIDILVKAVNDSLAAQAQAYFEQAKREGQQFTVPMPVLTTFLASTLQTLLIWWLDNDMPYSPEEMNEMFMQLAMGGIGSILE